MTTTRFFAAALLVLSTACTGDDTGTDDGQPVDECGDGSIDVGEQCDGTNFGSENCSDAGAAFGGELGCNADCTIDLSGCNFFATCGDGDAAGAEQCDGDDLRGNSCVDDGFTGGTLACSDCAFDTAACEGTGAVCGDDTKDGLEACDGPDLGVAACAFYGFSGGSISCNNDCTLNLDACFGGGEPVCGDGNVDGLEQCDGALGDITCADLGFDTGAVACTDCVLDVTGCSGTGRQEVLDRLIALQCRLLACTFAGGEAGCLDQLTDCNGDSPFAVLFEPEVPVADISACLDTLDVLTECDFDGLEAAIEQEVCELQPDPLPLGAACEGSFECGPDAECRFPQDPLECRTCAAIPTLGEPCNFDCADGLVCGVDSACVPGIVNGGACDLDFECASDFCLNNVCADFTEPDLGDACGDDLPSCQDPYTCVAGTCAAYVVVGGTCLNTDECLQGLRCTGGTCSPVDRCVEGGACGGAFDCNPGLECLYDGDDYSCGTPADLGGSCEFGGDCLDGLYCEYNFKTGTGTCQELSYPGEPCDGSVQCGPNAYCDFPSDVCTPYGGIGDECTSNFNCLSFYCDEVTGQCASEDDPPECSMP